MQIINVLLSRSESRQLEFKRVSGKMVGKALETICAFSNSQGGHLVLGIADLKEHQGKSRLFGVEENPEAVDELHRLLLTEFAPEVKGVVFRRLSCRIANGPQKGTEGHVLMLWVPSSECVHSIVHRGTYTRMDAGNRMLSAEEVTELSYCRGVRSATAEPVPISLKLLYTETWEKFIQARGPLSGAFADQLLRIALADDYGDKGVQPKRAAVLLFADEPGSLLAAHDSRADVRVMIYDGKQVSSSATPNLRKATKTIRGPLIEQIDKTVRVVLDELAQGLTLSASGFKTMHAYPARVVKEAIVNAIIHRDYRLNRDIFIRIFDDRIEVENPGTFPGNITPVNIAIAGSKARNPLLAANLREFPEAPNIDAGEGVRTMFSEMAHADLYPPQYRQSLGVAVPTVTVTLFNAKRPSTWDEVSDWLDRRGSIANADVVRISHVDTLKASKMLRLWKDQGLLVSLPGRDKRNMAYAKPSAQQSELSFLSEADEKNPSKMKKSI